MRFRPRAPGASLPGPSGQRGRQRAPHGCRGFCVDGRFRYKNSLFMENNTSCREELQQEISETILPVRSGAILNRVVFRIRGGGHIDWRGVISVL